jgi:iron complex transport system substrate-binding protein
MALTFLLITACNSSVIRSSNISTDRSETATKCRVVEQTGGKACIPFKPQRIITLEPWFLDPLFALGIKESIVGTTCYDFMTWIKQEQECVTLGLSSEQLKHLKNIEKVGNIYSPSLEKLLLLKPDLILGLNWTGSVYKQLADIAPMISFQSDDIKFSFKTFLRRFARLFDREEVAEEILVQYQNRIAEVRKQLDDRLKNAEVSVIIYGCSGNNEFSISPRWAVWFQILGDLGIRIKPVFSMNQEDWCRTNSIETINNYDSDILLIANFYRKSGTFLLEKPLIAHLNAVKNGRAYVIDGQDVWDVYGPYGVNRLLDILAEKLLKAAQTF